MLAAAEPIARNAIDALRAFAPFDRMDEQAFDYLGLHLATAEYATGTTILGMGHDAPRLHIIERGKVASEQPRLGDLVEDPYPVLGPGDLFPLAALFSGSAVTAVYRAVEPTRCLELSGRDFPELLRRAPALERLCVARVTSMLREARARLHGQFTQVTSEQQSMASPLRAIVRGAPVTCRAETPIRDAV